MPVSVRRVTAAETFPLRQRVLRPHETADALSTPPGNGEAVHLAAVEDGTVVGTAVVMREAALGHEPERRRGDYGEWQRPKTNAAKGSGQRCCVRCSHMSRGMVAACCGATLGSRPVRSTSVRDSSPGAMSGTIPISVLTSRWNCKSGEGRARNRNAPAPRAGACWLWGLGGSITRTRVLGTIVVVAYQPSWSEVRARRLASTDPITAGWSFLRHTAPPLRSRYLRSESR